MGESESAQQSKKRAAVKELSRDNPGLDDEEDSAELESGTFKRASDEVLASRRIVRIKRKEVPATVPSSNPFAAIRLVPPTEPAVETKSTPAEATSKTVAEGEKPTADDQRTDAAKDSEGIKDDNGEAIGSGKDAEVENNKVIDKETVESKVEDAVGEVTEKAKEESDNQDTEAAGDHPTDNCNTVKETDQTGGSNEKEASGDQTKNGREDENGSENVEKNGDGALSSFQQHSSTKNAFTGLAGTGFSSSSFSFGSVSQEGSTGSGSLFGQSAGQTPFSFGLSNNGNSSLFGNAGTPIITKSESSAFPSKEEVSVETGEENERVAFSADSVLFEFLDGAWKERGKGEIKINVSTCGNGKARLLMRARGNYRLILNAGLFPEMKLTNMDKKGITFACVNSIGEDKDGLSTFALKFKDPTFVEEFRAAVMQHQDGKPVEAAPLKTPENSPRAANA